MSKSNEPCEPHPEMPEFIKHERVYHTRSQSKKFSSIKTSKIYTVPPTLNNVFDYLIKPIKEVVLSQDPTAKIQLEDTDSNNRESSDNIIILKLYGTKESSEILSKLDNTFYWNGEYYVYKFICDSLDVNDENFEYDELETDHSLTMMTETIYKLSRSFNNPV